MKTHTLSFKENIKILGREFTDRITYTIDNEETVLTSEQLNSVSPHYETTLLKSVMKQLDIDSNIEIPVGTVLSYELGLKVGDEYEYINYGNYVVYSSEKQEDTNSWNLVCYDKMLYTMIDYQEMEITYPITIKNYISVICTHLGLDFANENDTFPNYDKEIESELFLSTDGTSLNYTFRDVLDQLSEVTASNICINENDELELRYVKNTVGKNLFDLKKYYENCIATRCTKTLINDGIKINFTAGTDSWLGDTLLSTDTPSQVILDRIKKESFEVKPNTKYTLSISSMPKCYISYLDEDYNGLSSSYIRMPSSYTQTSYTFTTPNNAKYVLFRFGIQDNNYTEWTFSNIQLEEGNNATEYEEYGLDTIDEEFLKDVNVNFGEKFGPVNSIVLSRAGQSDNVYIQDEESVEENGLCEIKIIENQIMNFNDRDEYLEDILNQLDGLEYYINDFSSTGICYYELCDMYNVSIDNNIYKCIMFNDETNRTQGLEELVYTPMPESAETDYKKADKTDRRINQAYLIVDKQNQTINGLVARQEEMTEELENNYYTKSTTDELILDTANGLINKYTVGGGNNIFRNTGLYFESQDYTSGFEFWDGNVKKVNNANSQSKTSMYLQNGSLEQKQDVVNNVYTVSFKYNQLNPLATASVTINENEYELGESGTFTEIIQVNANLIDLKFDCDVNDGYEIYELMVNFGETALNYSQNQNETKTDTVEISEGIKITSTTTDSTFKANADGIRVEDRSGNITTEFLDSGTKTEIINANQGIIANLLIQKVDNQTWITGLGG